MNVGIVGNRRHLEENQGGTRLLGCAKHSVALPVISIVWRMDLSDLKVFGAEAWDHLNGKECSYG